VSGDDQREPAGSENSWGWGPKGRRSSKKNRSPETRFLAHLLPPADRFHIRGLIGLRRRIEDGVMITLVKGFHDILPDQSRKWSFIVDTARSTLERFGFREIVPPIMEKSELFARGIGEVTDIVEKEMYTFEDRGGELLSLRPEATAGLLRSVVEHSLLKKEPVLKLYTIGPMFRRERPSKGRFRQFWQIDAEILGDDSPYTDAETIAAAHAIMADLGATDLVMEINSVGCRECRPVYRQALRSYLEKYLDDLCPDCQRRYHTNPLRVLDCKVERCAGIAKGAPLIRDSLDDACTRHFEAVRDALSAWNIPYRCEPTMVRGLDYYTRTAFEIIHGALGRTKAVGGGGRYDYLVQELGGPDVSGIGFAIGLERLAMGLPDDDPKFERTLDVYVAFMGDKARDAAIMLVGWIRNAGFSADIRYPTRSLKAQMKDADRMGAKMVVMIGEDELNRQLVTFRNLGTKEQATVEMDDARIAEYLKKAVGKPRS
jgi:histidyl-tRNA synthetase